MIRKELEREELGIRRVERCLTIIVAVVLLGLGTALYKIIRYVYDYYF